MILKIEDKLCNRDKFENFELSEKDLILIVSYSFISEDIWTKTGDLEELRYFFAGERNIPYVLKRVEGYGRALTIDDELLDLDSRRELAKKFASDDKAIIYEVWDQTRKSFYVLAKNDETIVTSEPLRAEIKYDVLRFLYRSIDHLLILTETSSYGSPLYKVDPENISKLPCEDEESRRISQMVDRIISGLEEIETEVNYGVGLLKRSFCNNIRVKRDAEICYLEALRFFEGEVARWREEGENYFLNKVAKHSDNPVGLYSCIYGLELLRDFMFGLANLLKEIPDESCDFTKIVSSKKLNENIKQYSPILDDVIHSLKIIYKKRFGNAQVELDADLIEEEWMGKPRMMIMHVYGWLPEDSKNNNIGRELSNLIYLGYEKHPELSKKFDKQFKKNMRFYEKYVCLDDLKTYLMNKFLKKEIKIT